MTTFFTPFDRMLPEDLYPGFDPEEGPDIGDFWDPETMQTREKDWDAARNIWVRVKAYRNYHSAKYIPIPDAYEIPRPLRLWAEEILEGKPVKPLLVHGHVGVGKTHGVCAMACLLAALWDRPIYVEAPPISFHTASRLLSQLKDFGSRDERQALYFAVTNAKVLVVDDLTRGSITDHDMETLGQVVDERQGKSLPTIFTVNHDPDTDLTELMPAFLASRLSAGQQLHIIGKDRRA